MYNLNGLSFREYIELQQKRTFPVLALGEILENPLKQIQPILQEIKPIKLFEEYVQFGYYPFFSDGLEEYGFRIKQIVNYVIDADLPSVERVDFNGTHHLKTLLSVISEIVPFTPNISKLSNQVGVSRETLMRYLNLLERADLLLLLQSGNRGISKMNKPEKVYLNNTNLFHALAQEKPNVGSLRETFFYNQLRVGHKVSYPAVGDFIVDGKYTFEIGGKNKAQKQIEGIENAFIAADNVEFSHENRIPLWLFGFLY